MTLPGMSFLSAPTLALLVGSTVLTAATFLTSALEDAVGLLMPLLRRFITARTLCSALLARLPLLRSRSAMEGGVDASSVMIERGVGAVVYQESRAGGVMWEETSEWAGGMNGGRREARCVCDLRRRQ